MKLKMGQPIELEIDKRYYRMNREYAVRDIYDAFVELITNSDDSYNRLYKHKKIKNGRGPILIEVTRSRKYGSIVKIYDKAEGMTMDNMFEKIRKVGKRESEAGDRGFMARGAKDCTSLGEIFYDSIKDNRYYRCKLTQKSEFIPLLNQKVTSNIRAKLKIKRGNGTVASLHIPKDSIISVPREDTILKDLPWHYSLRDILSETSAVKIMTKTRTEKVAGYQPEATEVYNEEFTVPDYPMAKARLVIHKTEESLEDPTDKRFRKTGILVKGSKAIHECSMLNRDLEKDPYSAKYFGRIECDFIDELLEDYDYRSRHGESLSKENPSLLLDPNRREGLVREHPFTKMLFLTPIKVLNKLIDDDKSKDKQKKHQISNKETKKRLSQLAKAASKFLKERVDEIEQTTNDDRLDSVNLASSGLFIFPKYLKIVVGETKRLSVYASKAIFKGKQPRIKIISDKSIDVLKKEITLEKHPSMNDRYRGIIVIQGKELSSDCQIRAIGPNNYIAKAGIKIVETKIEQYSFSSDLEFECKKYTVKEGSSKTLRVYAKYPETVNQAEPIKTISLDNESIPVRGRAVLTPVSGSNYALAEVNIKGKRLKNKPVKIQASLNGFNADTLVSVKQKEDQGSNITIDIRDEDYGNFRAIWAKFEKKPNLLLISAKHSSIKRYLGPGPKFEGQDKTYFRVLLAEIVTESICRKALAMEAQTKPFEFTEWVDRDPKMVADSVMAQLQKRIRDFSARAHSIMLPQNELSE